MDFLDEDIIYNPMYWLLTAGVEFALILGFKGASNGMFGLVASTGEMGIPWYTEILALIIMPVIIYFTVMKISS